MWFHGIFLQTMGLPRSQNNWTEPSSCYLLAQRAVVWCHSMLPPLALARSPCWVVEFLCWRSCLIDNSICVGVITAWLIGREGTLGHCHYWHTGTTPHTFADGRGTRQGRVRRDQGRHERRLVCMWKSEVKTNGGKAVKKGEWVFRVGRRLLLFFAIPFFLLGYAATIVLCCSPSAIDSLLSHTHRSARAKPVKLPIVYPTSDTPLKNCRCVWQVGLLIWEKMMCWGEEHRKANHLYLHLFHKQNCTNDLVKKNHLSSPTKIWSVCLVIILKMEIPWYDLKLNMT